MDGHYTLAPLVFVITPQTVIVGKIMFSLLGGFVARMFPKSFYCSSIFCVSHVEHVTLGIKQSFTCKTILNLKHVFSLPCNR